MLWSRRPVLAASPNALASLLSPSWLTYLHLLPSMLIASTFLFTAVQCIGVALSLSCTQMSNSSPSKLWWNRHARLMMYNALEFVQALLPRYVHIYCSSRPQNFWRPYKGNLSFKHCREDNRIITQGVVSALSRCERLNTGILANRDSPIRDTISVEGIYRRWNKLERNLSTV